MFKRQILKGFITEYVWQYFTSVGFPRESWYEAATLINLETSLKLIFQPVQANRMFKLFKQYRDYVSQLDDPELFFTQWIHQNPQFVVTQDDRMLLNELENFINDLGD